MSLLVSVGGRALRLRSHLVAAAHLGSLQFSHHFAVKILQNAPVFVGERGKKKTETANYVPKLAATWKTALHPLKISS